jgi:hypothetical protein
LKNILAEVQKGDDDMYSFVKGRATMDPIYNFRKSSLMDNILLYFQGKRDNFNWFNYQPSNNFNQYSEGSDNCSGTLGNAHRKGEEETVLPIARRGQNPFMSSNSDNIARSLERG